MSSNLLGNDPASISVADDFLRKRLAKRNILEEFREVLMLVMQFIRLQ